MKFLKALVYLIPTSGSSGITTVSILTRYVRSSIGPLRGASCGAGKGKRFKATSRTVSAVDQTSELILQADECVEISQSCSMLIGMNNKLTSIDHLEFVPAKDRMLYRQRYQPNC